MRIHKEGYTIILFSIIILLGLNITFCYILPYVIFIILLFGSFALLTFIVQFFRNPKREIIAQANEILAPADGKVVVIEETFESEYLKENRIQISIFMSPLNVHANRNPISGEISYTKYHKGKYLVAWHPKSSIENERNTVVIKSQNGLEILFRQIAGAMARRIKCYVRKGDNVQQGKEFGFIKFGSRVDIFLPLDAQVKVKIGDKSIAGKTILGQV